MALATAALGAPCRPATTLRPAARAPQTPAAPNGRQQRPQRRRVVVAAGGDGKGGGGLGDELLDFM